MGTQMTPQQIEQYLRQEAEARAAGAGGVTPQGPPAPLDPSMPLPGAGAPPGAMPAPNVNPDTVQAVLGMHQLAPEQAQVARQQKLADALRAGAGQQLQGSTAGRMTAAPGLLNLAANVGQNYMANRKEQDADASAAALGVKQSDIMRKYFESLTGKPQIPGGMGGGVGGIPGAQGQY